MIQSVNTCGNVSSRYAGLILADYKGNILPSLKAKVLVIEHSDTKVFTQSKLSENGIGPEENRMNCLAVAISL